MAQIGFRDCETAHVDLGLARALASIERHVALDVHCIGGDDIIVTRIASGEKPLDSRVTLPHGTPALRARFLGFVLSEIARGKYAPTARVAPPKRVEKKTSESTPPAKGANPTEPVAAPVSPAPGVPPPASTAAPEGVAQTAPFTLDVGPLLEVGSARTPIGGTSEVARGPRVVPSDVPRINPIELAIVPSVGLNQVVGYPVRNNFAFGLLAVRSTWLEGLSLSPVSLIQRGSVGMQLGGIFAQAEGSLIGYQLAGAVGIIGDTLRGVQTAPVALASDVMGLQIGLVNIGYDITGAQIGIVNIAHDVRGTQIGVVNVAHRSDVPVGIVNAIEDTPWRYFAQLGNGSIVSVGLKTTGSFAYSKFTVGWTPLSILRLGIGLGFRVGQGLGWYFEPEIEAQSVWDLRRVDSFTKQGAFLFRGNVGYQLFERFAVYASAGFQFLLVPDTVRPDSIGLLVFTVAPGFGIGPEIGLGVQF